MQLVSVGVRRSVRDVPGSIPKCDLKSFYRLLFFLVALSSVRLCTDGEEGRGKEGEGGGREGEGRGKEGVK